MLLRNFMAAEFDKGQAEFLAGARPSGSNWPNSKPPRSSSCSKPARIVEIRKLATELNQLYDQVLAENEPGMPKYALMVDAAIRDADTPLVTLLAETFGAISEATRQTANGASQVADSRYEANVTILVLVGLSGAVLSLALAVHSSRHILQRLGGELEPVVTATTRVAEGDLTQSLESGKAAADSLVASIERMQGRLRVLIGDVKCGAETTSSNALALRQSAQEVASHQRAMRRQPSPPPSGTDHRHCRDGSAGNAADAAR
jgi:methyl-accepting chemotaxis protein